MLLLLPLLLLLPHPQYAMTTYLCAKVIADTDGEERLPSIRSPAALRQYLSIIDSIVQASELSAWTGRPPVAARPQCCTHSMACHAVHCTQVAPAA